MTDTERAAYIRSVVDRAPCLSSEDAQRVRALLPVRGTALVRRTAGTRRRDIRSQAA